MTAPIAHRDTSAAAEEEGTGGVGRGTWSSSSFTKGEAAGSTREEEGSRHSCPSSAPGKDRAGSNKGLGVFVLNPVLFQRSVEEG